jgi:acylphosphatase
MTGRHGDPSGSARVEVVVGGDVQGVGFRMFVARAAGQHALTGWVANEPDGSVRCVAEGPRASLEAFVRELAVGPPSAVIERFTVAWSEALDGFDRFAIRSGWHGGD